MDDEMIQAIRDEIKLAIQAELGAYKIPKEEHYKQHLFLKDLMEFANTSRNIVISTIIRFVVGGIIALVILGFILWGRKNF